MKKAAVLLSLAVFFTVSCAKKEQEEPQVSTVSFTPCQQVKAKSNELSDKVDVKFTNEGVKITYYNFEVTCDFTTVNKENTFVNGVLNITQQSYPNQAKCVCYTDVSYTINGISKNEVNVIFINGEQVYCYKENEGNQDDLDFCSCLSIENINKTIPIINKFLARLPDGISKEKTFESLETWLNSFPCNIDAKILIGEDMIWGREQMHGVAIPVKDGNKIRELELDFAVIEHNGNLMLTYSQIAGYVYYKQDAVFVKTQYTEIDKVFEFINSLDLDVQEIQGGIYLSSMPANTETLQYVINNLKAKPYTTDTWVSGHLNWYNANFVIFVRLYDMKNANYQADWKKTMSEYKLKEYTSGTKYMVGFYIPEGTGKQWETYFTGYNFVDWAELGYTRYTII